MSLEAGIIAYLKTDSNLMALVGNGDSPVTCRIYPVRLPQNWTAPAITYQRISAERLYNLSGPAGRSTVRIQFDIVAQTYLSAKNIADKLRAALNGYNGLMGSVDVGNCSLDNEFDGYLADTDTFRISMDYMLNQLES